MIIIIVRKENNERMNEINDEYWGLRRCTFSNEKNWREIQKKSINLSSRQLVESRLDR